MVLESDIRINSFLCGTEYFLNAVGQRYGQFFCRHPGDVILGRPRRQPQVALCIADDMDNTQLFVDDNREWQEMLDRHLHVALDNFTAVAVRPAAIPQPSLYG